MIRTLSVLTIAVLCASCRTDSSPDLSRADPIINNADFNAREECLHQEVARLLEPKNSPLISLQHIAMIATIYCSRAITEKLQGTSASAARDDQIKTEQRAFAIGLKLREKRASR